MIVFDLKCGQDHVFEAWFDSSSDFVAQNKHRLISCPLCGDGTIAKALMAPNIPAKNNRKSGTETKLPVASANEKSPAEIKAALEMLAHMQREVEEKADWVGDKFADEARAIHYGETEDRPIYGEATLADAQDLHEEGVPVMPLPFRSKRKRADA
jgi:hypothetical protein